MKRTFALMAAALLLAAAPAAAESVIRYGISLADIPQTTGQPDRGAGLSVHPATRSTDPLVAWEMTLRSGPAS